MKSSSCIILVVAVLAMSAGGLAEAGKRKHSQGYAYVARPSYYPVAAAPMMRPTVVRPVVRPTAPACHSVPYTETVMSTQYEAQSYDCSYSATTEQCKDVQSTQNRTCNKSEEVWTDYDCSYTETQQVCDAASTPVVSSKSSHGRYLKGVQQQKVQWVAPPQPKCRSVETRVPKTCQRSKTVSTPYSCPEVVVTKQCNPVSTRIPKTCSENVAVQVPSQVTRYRQVCNQQRAYVPVVATPYYGSKSYGSSYGSRSYGSYGRSYSGGSYNRRW